MASASPAQQQSRAGSYMTFRAGSAHYAVPVQYIRYITSLDSVCTRATPDCKGVIHKIMDFEGKSIVLYRFNQLIGAPSQIEQCNTLVQSLKQRRQEHIDWIVALEHSIRTGESFQKATDPHKCAFGLWYDQYRPDDEELREIMAQFDKPHCRIHSLAERLLGLAQQDGRIDEAINELERERYSTLKTLLTLFDQAEARLLDMVKSVALILDVGTKIYALELDGIEDIQNFENAHWLADSKIREEGGVCYDGFFQKIDGALYLKLDPVQLAV